MIEFHLVLKAPLHKTRVILEAMQVLAKNVRSEPGCLNASVYRTVGLSSRIYYQETWDSEEVLKKMILSRHFSQLVTLMELSVEPPDCQFRFIQEVRALDYAEYVREGIL
jgi:quinol monooxygenase YgiN